MSKKWQDSILDVIHIQGERDPFINQVRSQQAFYNLLASHNIDLRKVECLPTQVYTQNGKLACDYVTQVTTQKGREIKTVKGAKLAKCFSMLDVSPDNLRDMLNSAYAWARERYFAVIDRHYYDTIYTSMHESSVNDSGVTNQIRSCMSKPIDAYSVEYRAPKDCPESKRFALNDTRHLHPITVFGLMPTAVLVCSVSAKYTDGVSGVSELIKKLRSDNSRSVPFTGRYMYSAGLNYHGCRGGVKTYGNFPIELIPSLEDELHRRKFVLGERGKDSPVRIVTWASKSRSKFGRAPYVDYSSGFNLVEQDASILGFTASMNIYEAVPNNHRPRAELGYSLSRGEISPRDE